jgi:ATP-dependent RNA helicase DDX10/DBP4
MGLPGAPQIKLLEKTGKNTERGVQKKEEEDTGPTIIHQRLAESDDSGEDSEEGSEDGDDESGSGSGSGSESESGSDSDEAPRAAPQVRTKYDRMFERKNQSILTDHYSKLVSHEGGDDEDDVFTLARRDHDLDLGSDAEVDPTAPIDSIAKQLITADDLSKRKLKDATTRKGQLKTRGLGSKMLFDDEGQARDFYEHGKDVEQGAAAEEVRRAFVEEESKRMREADVVDREVARDKRREKKRKRKEREREVSVMNIEASTKHQADMTDDGRNGWFRLRLGRRGGRIHRWRQRRRRRIRQ